MFLHQKSTPVRKFLRRKGLLDGKFPPGKYVNALGVTVTTDFLENMTRMGVQFDYESEDDCVLIYPREGESFIFPIVYRG